MDEIAAILLQIFIVLVFAKALGSVFEKFNMPKLIGEIIAGAVFINLIIFTPFGDFLSFDIAAFNGEDGAPISFFHIMGELGIIFLLFAVGLETKFSDMKKVGKTSSYIAILGILIPFAGGMLFIFHESVGFKVALLIGAALFGTSTAVGVECLRNLKAMNTTEAKMIVSATIIDDILCLALIGVIIGAVQEDATTVSIIVNAVVVAAFVLIMFFFVSRVKKMAAIRAKRMQERHERKNKNREDSGEYTPRSIGELGALGLAIIVCLGLAALSANIKLAAIIGAFLAGMIFAEFKDTIPVEHNFNVIVYFMLPFFFIWVGMELQFDRVEIGILPMLGAILFVAILTKYVAGYMGAKLGKLSHESAHLIGVSFIPRGEVGIIVAVIGYSALGVLNVDWFTIIILMALITSLITPLLVMRAYKKLEKSRTAAFEEAFKEHDGI